MKTAVFSSKPYDARFLVAANANAAHELDFYEERLSPHTARLADGHGAICAFVNDLLNARVLDILKSLTIGMVALRCAGFNRHLSPGLLHQHRPAEHLRHDNRKPHGL